MASVTGAPEMLGGRVKTLHPTIHGGILADRSKPEHLADLDAQGIEPIDLVVCNLYPFRSDPSIELIDVGGPTMVRAAAKNHAHVGVVVDPADYGPVLDELRRGGPLSRRHAPPAGPGRLRPHRRLRRRHRRLVRRAGGPEGSPSSSADVHLALERAAAAALRGEPPPAGGPLPPDRRAQLVGRRGPARRAWSCRTSTSTTPTRPGGSSTSWPTRPGEPAVAIIKHANPCGAASPATSHDAYRRALECDPMSAFGGIVALRSGRATELAAELVAKAPGRRHHRPRLRRRRPRAPRGQAQEHPAPRGRRPTPPPASHLRQLGGGYLVQEPDRFATTRDEWRVVTKAAPTEEQWRDLELAWRVCAGVKSNAIVLVADGQAVGIGGGQQNRVEPGEIAARKAGGRAKGGAAASDAFFPFRDGLDALAAAGVAAVIQPGGSLRDDEVIAAADEHGIAMVFTGERHFRH